MIRAFWYLSNNFGDNLNWYLLNKLSEKRIVYVNQGSQLDHYIVCGSILSLANENTTVWGAGFGDNTQTLNGNTNVISVRGELSANNIKQDVSIVGDPALIMPYIYKPKLKKYHKIGIIPHFLDIERFIHHYSDYYIINPLQPVESFINEIFSCEMVYSQSLHGLIVCDAYNIPNVWIDTKANIGGDGIKFLDYYSTTKTGYNINKIVINDNSQKLPTDLFQVNNYKGELLHLLGSCPFLSDRGFYGLE